MLLFCPQIYYIHATRRFILTQQPVHTSEILTILKELLHPDDRFLFTNTSEQLVFEKFSFSKGTIHSNFIELNNSKILICPDNLKNIKPDPEGVLLACSKLNINPSETIYIGDHQKDLEAGLNAGCKVIGCRYGYSINENTNTYNADLINTPEEIISLIE